MIKIFYGVGWSSNTYLIDNIIIDPGTEENVNFILDNVKKVDFIINTHCHYDHTSGNYILEEIFGCPTIIHDREVKHLKNADEVTVSYLFNSKLIPPKEIIPLSEIVDELNFEIIETPGHTYGSISLIYKNYLITGDTLFSNSIGRWDFPTGNFEELKKSIYLLENISYKKGIDTILPGHGEIADLKAFEYAKIFLEG